MEAAEKDTSTMQNKGEVHRLGSKKANRPPRIEQTRKDKPVERCYGVDIDQQNVIRKVRKIENKADTGRLGRNRELLNGLQDN